MASLVIRGVWEVGIRVAPPAYRFLRTTMAGKAALDAVKAREAAKTEAAKCDPTNPLAPCNCPPRSGMMRSVNHSMSELSRAYQARITGFPPGREWFYGGVDFDGFRYNACALQEAKGHYLQFLDPATGHRTWHRWYSKSFLGQAMRQSAVAVPRPPVVLQWFFMELPVYTVSAREFLRAGLPIICIHQP